MHNNDPKTENNITIDEQEIKATSIDERNRNDKRYEEPFENDGAYADDSDSD
jgi:hypothetical protein